MESEPFYFDVLEFRKDLIKSTKPEFLYHYTTAAGILGILPTDSGKQMTFWLTDSRYLNDSEEYNGGLKIGKDCLINSEHSKHQLLNNAMQSLDCHNGRICVLSLSENGNLLSQWRAYSEDGGYSLKLKSKLFDGPSHLSHRYLAECIYSEEKLRNKVNKSIEWHVRQYQQASDGKSDSEQQHLLSHCSDGLIGSIRILASVFKHESFEEETEWRHVFQYPNDQEINLRVRSGLLIPFTSIAFPIESLEGIFVAPGSRELLAKSAAEDLLQRHGSDNLCKVELSGSPYIWDG